MVNSNPSSESQVNDQPIAFKAEIRQLLDILIHSLYTEREIFLRELLSNASDALNRIHFEMLTNRDVVDADAKLCVRIKADEQERLLTIEDTGIGMTRQELEDNLGIIARSGAKAFLETMKQRELAKGNEQQPLSDIIGQFGVGFYSVFMVAEWVKVTSRSYLPDEKSYAWYASGGESYTITPAEKTGRGTTIEIKLKEDANEFTNENRIKQIIHHHSDYIAFPIYWGDGDEQLNKVSAIWRQSPSEIKEEEYKEFYKQITLDYEDPLFHVHLVADAPVQVHALLFIPAKSERLVYSLRKDDGLKLYARNVLIQEYCKDLLPQYLRFVQGVVDSEDLPLNVSRESVQSNVWMARLKKVVSGKINSALKEMALKDGEKYLLFWQEYGRFIKEGISTIGEEQDKNVLSELLRFHTTKFPDTWSSLNDYIGRMKAGQKSIYYVLGDDPRSIFRSPHLDYFNGHGYEVITMAEAIDSFMILGLNTFEGFALKNVASADLPDEVDVPQEEKTSEKESVTSEYEELINRFKTQLGDNVTDIRVSKRLSDSVARLVDPEGGMNQEMQRVFRMLGQNVEIPKKVLEINPNHPILKKVMAMNENSDMSNTVIDLIFQNALLIEGLHPDPASIIPLTQKLMEAALSGN